MLLAVSACAKQGDGKEVASGPVSAQFALCVRGGTVTKADASVIQELQETPAFSGLSGMHIFPFASTGDIEAADAPLKHNFPTLAIDSNGLVEASLAHLFGEEVMLTFPRNTASLLVYGKAAPGGDPSNPVAYKHLNGSLIEQGFTQDAATASALSLLPEAMLPGGGTPAAASGIAAVLSSIMLGDSFSLTAHFGGDKTQTVSMAWDEHIADDNLRECYEDITAAGALLPGSGASVSAMLTTLYRSLQHEIINSEPYEIEKDGVIYADVTKDDNTPLTYGDLFRGVRDVVLARFSALQDDHLLQISAEEPYTVSFYQPAMMAYPEQLGLPSGAAVVRWTPSGYVVPLENGLDGIAPISAYCYPPPLYYYANSTIRTSDDAAGVKAAYVAGNTWDDILDAYTDGTVVVSHTHAVALEHPLQFAVGMLKATVKAGSAKLQDNDGKDYTLVDASGTNFPLTGVIIGRQYPVGFDFTPQYVSDAVSKQYYLYDDRMPSGIYLHVPEGNEALIPFRTLALETPPGKETYFCLEFRNDSGNSFYGAEGRIHPGHKFYLVGKLDFPTDAFDKVFIQDYVTTVICEVTTLKNAHNAVPDMGIPQLTLGVETRVDWEMSTPATLMFE